MFGLEAIWRDGKVVGHIRRADFGFAIDKTIAYGYIRDPAGGPVSAAPRHGCASFPALPQTHCCHLGWHMAQQLLVLPPGRLEGEECHGSVTNWCHPLSLGEVHARLQCCLGC